MKKKKLTFIILKDVSFERLYIIFYAGCHSHLFWQQVVLGFHRTIPSRHREGLVVVHMYICV